MGLSGVEFSAERKAAPAGNRGLTTETIEESVMAEDQYSEPVPLAQCLAELMRDMLAGRPGEAA